MRTIIGAVLLVAAVGAAGTARKHKAEHVRANPPIESAPTTSEREDAPPSPPAEESGSLLPLFEVGPAEDDVESPKTQPAAATVEKSIDEPAEKKEEAKPVEKTPDPQPTPAQLAMYQEFFQKMLRFEMMEIRDCYREARRRYPRLHRDFTLTLTVNRDAEGERVLESSSMDSYFYRPPAFEKCVQNAVADILLPPVDNRVTVSFPVTLNPQGLYDEDDD